MISYQTTLLLEQVADEIKDKAGVTAGQRDTILDILVENLGDTLTTIDIADSYNMREYTDERDEEY